MRLLKFISLIPLLLTLTGTRARAAEALWTHQFTAESGFPLSLSQGEAATQTLTMFWASWCLPCKEELSELVRRQNELPKNLRIVAISVDDPSGLPLAQAFLASIHWPFQILRDNAGQFFFDYNHAGQLPFSVLVGPKGQEIKSYQKLSSNDISEIVSSISAEVNAPAQGLKTSFGFHAEGVDFTGDNGIHNRMATGTGFARLDSQHWDGQIQYDYMYEQLNNPTAIVRGDEIGYSYLEYRGEVAAGRAQVRLGDTHEAIMAGELLSLQNIPNLTDPASLRGGSAQWDQGDWSLVAFGGTIHPALFASPINPTSELALPVPGETAKGGSVFWHHDSSEAKNQINLNFVNYHRNTDLDLGYASPINDQRVGGELYHSSGKSGVQVRYAHFSTNTGIAGVDAERPYIFDPYVWWAPSWSTMQIYGFHYIEYQSLPVRTLTPVLVENPALPLQAAKIRSFRLSPKFSNEEESLWVEPIWIFEEAFDILPYERQNSYGMNLSLPKRDQKLVVFYQNGLLAPGSAYQESSFLATSPVYGPLTTQLLLRHHNGNLLNGDSDGLNLGLDLSRMWSLPFKGKLLLSTQWTRQSGYYFGFSGISRSDLVSGHLEWTNGINTIKLGVGSEPGGIVCTNGVCVQKPPLNGIDLETAFNF